MTVNPETAAPGAAVEAPLKSKAAKLGVVVDVAKPEDMEELVRVFWDAFSIIFPFNLTEPLDKRPDDATRLRRSAARKLYGCGDGTDDMVLKAVDRVTGEIVGYASWITPEGSLKAHPFIKDEERAKTDEAYREAWDGVDGLWSELWAGWDEHRIKVLDGKPHWFLGPLAVKTSAQGRGVGKSLLRHVIAIADAASPPQDIYLDASEAGQPVYKSVGFEYIGDRARPFPGMVRRGGWKPATADA